MLSLQSTDRPASPATRRDAASVLPFSQPADSRAAKPKSNGRMRTGDEGLAIWAWIRCYLFRVHDFRIQCAPGRIFLECEFCGTESSGWELDAPKARPIPLNRTPRARDAAGSAEGAHARHQFAR